MITRLVLYAVVAFMAPQVLSGIRVKTGKAAVLIALVFTVLNAIIGPLLTVILTMISLPAIVLTLGLFALIIPAIINAALLMLTGGLLDDFELDGCFPACLMGFLFALVGFVTGSVS
ncbi:MAG: putative membrane protein [Planctomycetota bacterium]|jgi:putative membrane protein